VTIAETDIARWREAIGQSEIRRQRLDPEFARRYAAAIGVDLDVERSFPPLGHWAYFLDAISPAAIGADGHPKRGGGVMPDVSLPRRMFAGGALDFHAPLTLGRDAELTLTIADVRHRAGRSGELVFVDVDRVIAQDGETRITERQTIVYRDPGDRLPPIVPAEAPTVSGQDIWTPTSVDLFRFSAVTFNSHRIHYDLPYAIEREGYPGLVVHGPFTAAKLFAQAQTRGPICHFTFQAKAPIFEGQSVHLSRSDQENKVEAIRCDGAIAMSATFGLESSGSL